MRMEREHDARPSRYVVGVARETRLIVGYISAPHFQIYIAEIRALVLPAYMALTAHFHFIK